MKLRFNGVYTHGRDTIEPMPGLVFTEYKPLEVPDSQADELLKGEFETVGASNKKAPHEMPASDEPEPLDGKDKKQLMKIAEDEEVDLKGGSSNKSIREAIEKARNAPKKGLSPAEAQGYTVEGRSREDAEPEVSQAEAQGYTVEESPES